MSNEIDQLVQLLRSVLSPEDEVRENAEEAIKNLALEKPDAFVTGLLQVLEGDYNFQDKQSACVWTQKALSTFLAGLPELYYKITPETRAHWKKQIFLILANEKEEKTRNQIADTIGEVGGGLLSDTTAPGKLGDEPVWPELIPHTMDLFKTKDEKLVESALRILSALFLYGAEKFANDSPKIKQLLEQCMEFGNEATKALAIRCLGSLLATLPAINVKEYFSFSKPVLTVCKSMLFEAKNVDLTSEILINFSDIVETEPKFFKNVFVELIDLLAEIRNLNDIEAGVKDQCIEIAVSLSQRYPEMLKKNQTLMQKVVEIIFSQMMELPDENDDEWLNPPDGYDDETDQSSVKFATDCIDRLISHVGAKTMLGFLSDCIKNLLQSGDDWKRKHTAFMALSQIGEYMDNPEEARPIIQTIGEYINHDNPRVRYACLHCLGQLSDDMAPDFQILYLDLVMPMVAQRLQDKVPRVIGHACACLTNVVESCNQPDTQIKPFIEELYNKLWELIKNSTSYIQENALSAISALSVGATEKYFGPFYDQNMEHLLKIIENVTDKKYRKLVGNAIECASITSKVVGKERFNKWCARLVNDMIAIQKQTIDSPDVDGDDPQLAYLLAAWQRVSYIMEEDFHPYIDQMMPTLISLCRKIIKTGKKYETEPDIGENKEDDKINAFNVFEDDNCFVAINMMRLFLKKCKTALSKWVKQIYEVVVQLMTYLPNDSVRTTASRCLPSIILAMKGTESEKDIPEFAKLAASEIWKTMDVELEVESLLLHCKNMQALIENAGDFLNETEIDLMYQKCIGHLQNSHRRKIDSNKHKDAEDNEAELQEVLEAEQNMEDEFSCQIAEIIGKLMQTHQMKTLKVVEDVNIKFIDNSLAENQPPRLKKFGLFLICDIVDHLGALPAVQQAYFDKYYKILIQFSTHEVVYVRHAAVFGLGTMALRLGGNFAPLFEESLKTLKTALAMELGENDSKMMWRQTRDNCIASLGKLLQSVSDKLLQNGKKEELKTLLREWVLLLPLKWDEEEALGMHKMLILLLENSEDMLIDPTDTQFLESILRSFAWLNNNFDYIDKESNTKMGLIMKRWSENEQMKNLINSINFDDATKQIFMNIINNAGN